MKCATHPIRKKKRKPSAFARIYGSKARVEFVKSLPCAACGVVGYSENAHLLGNGGLSRKAGFETIAPLCRTRMTQNGATLTITYGSTGAHRSVASPRISGLTPEQSACFEVLTAAADLIRNPAKIHPTHAKHIADDTRFGRGPTTKGSEVK